MISDHSAGLCVLPTLPKSGIVELTDTEPIWPSADFYEQYKKACNFRRLQVAVQMELCLHCFYVLGDYELLVLRWEGLESESLDLLHA